MCWQKACCLQKRYSYANSSSLPVMSQISLNSCAFQSGDSEGGGTLVHISAASEPATRRFGADICLVIDVSGSMQLPATVKDREGAECAELSILDVVVHSCRTVCATLTSGDRIGIVAYSDRAQTVLPLTDMDANGQAQAEAALSRLRADGQTNLWDGLQTGLEMLRNGRSTSTNTMSSALLLTDGVPNVDPAGGHLAALEDYRRSAGGKLPCALHTFGFGYELNSQLLDELAHAGGGLYVFIPDAGFVGTALVNCSSNAVTAAGHNAELVLHLEDAVRVDHCFGYTLQTEQSGPSGPSGPSGTCRIHLGSIQLGQTKDGLKIRQAIGLVGSHLVS